MKKHWLLFLHLVKIIMKLFWLHFIFCKVQCLLLKLFYIQYMYLHFSVLNVWLLKKEKVKTAWSSKPAGWGPSNICAQVCLHGMFSSVNMKAQFVLRSLCLDALGMCARHHLLKLWAVYQFIYKLWFKKILIKINNNNYYYSYYIL